MKSRISKSVIFCVALGVAGVAGAAPKAVKPAAGKAAPKRTLGPAVALALGGSEGRISAADVAMARTLQAGTPSTGSDAVTPQQANSTFLVAHAEFDSAESCKKLSGPGFRVFNRYDRWADVFVDTSQTDALKGVTTAPGVVWVEIGRRVTVPPPPETKTAASRAPAEPIVRGGVSGLTGKGVVIAVVDSGIDFRHPDFITKDASGKPVSRIKYYWDTVTDWAPGKPGRLGPVAFPNGTSVGTTYTQDDLTAELQAPTRSIGPLDTNGHGTSCAGIAAGNGLALPDRRYTGVAPQADLIGVRIGPGPALPNSYLMGAIADWVDAVTGSRPVVVSCSFGGQFGGRDGQRVLERQLSARFAPDRPGRALCIAAGNDGADPIHGEVSFTGESSPGVFTWNVPADATGATLDVYLDNDDTQLSLRTTLESKLDLRKGRGHIYPLTKQLVWSIDLSPGAGELRLFSPTGKPHKADAYIKAFGSKGRAEFTGACVNLGKQVGTPGTTANAITVGSYDWNNEFESKRGVLILGDVIRTTSDGKPSPLVIGGISSYSCPGPARTGTVKPEIAAPGQFHIASAPTQTGGDKLLHVSGLYQPFNGTSAATPYVSGVVALMMEKKPQITGGEIKKLLGSCASSDRFTGSVPNARWGYGKLDLAAVRKLVDSVK